MDKNGQVEDHCSKAPESYEVFFIDREDKDFAEAIENARKKLQVQTAPAMPCKWAEFRNGKICIQKDDHKSKVA